MPDLHSPRTATRRPVTLRRLLRSVDGWPHVAIGPILLVFSARLADAVGVSRTGLLVFLVVFTLYGVVVLLGSRAAEVPRWLAAVAVVVNVAYVGVVALSLVVSDLTTPGAVLHAVLVLNGLGVTAVLLRLSAAQFRPGLASGR